MRVVSGGWHSPNLANDKGKKKKQQVNPALWLLAICWLQF
jgi:hypothetical protein